MLNKALLDLTEILCLYLVLRGIDRFKVKDSLIFIFTTKQYVRWGNIVMLFSYVIGINIIWQFDRDVGHYLSIIGSLVIPSFMIQIWRISIKKILFALLMFLLISVVPAVIIYIINLPNVLAFIMMISLFTLLVQFEVVYKVYYFLASRPLLLNAWCVAGLLLLSSSFASWYNYIFVLLILMGTFFLGGIIVYEIQKYHEKKFITSLTGISYLELRNKLKEKSLRTFETDRLDFYELNAIWFPKTFNQSLNEELSRLNLTADFIKEGNRLKIHLFKNE